MVVADADKWKMMVQKRNVWKKKWSSFRCSMIEKHINVDFVCLRIHTVVGARTMLRESFVVVYESCDTLPTLASIWPIFVRSLHCSVVWLLRNMDFDFEFVANIFHQPSQSTFFGSNSNQCTGYTYRIGRMEAVCFVRRSCCRSAENWEMWITEKLIKWKREKEILYSPLFLFSAFSVESAAEIPHSMQNEGKKELIFSRFGRFEMRKKNINIDCRYVFVCVMRAMGSWNCVLSQIGMDM